MRAYKVLLTLLFALVCHTSSMRAVQLSMGEWAIHSSFYTPHQVEEVGDYIYYTSEGNLFYYHKEENRQNQLTRLNGLSDSEIDFISYNNSLDQLVILYTNSNIDVIVEGEIYNIPDLKSEMMGGSKQINSISYYDNTAYLSTDFGILLLDMVNFEVIQTFNLRERVTAAAQYSGDIYISTSEGVKRMSANCDTWFEPSSWSKVSDVQVDQMISCYGHLIWWYGEAAYDYTPTTLRCIVDATPIRSVKPTSNGLLLVGKNNGIYSCDKEMKLQQVVAMAGCRFVDAALNNSSSLFWTLGEEGISALKRRVDDTATTLEVENYKYATHNVTIPYNLVYADGYLYVNNEALTAHNLDPENGATPGLLSVLNPSGEWVNLLPNSDIVGVQAPSQPLNNLQDIQPDPNEAGSFYVGTINEGIAHFKGLTFDRYYNDNFTDDPSFNYATNAMGIMHAMDFDTDGNLWAHYCRNLSPIENCIVMRTPSNQWEVITYPLMQGVDICFSQMLIPERSTPKWLVYTGNYDSGFLFAFDDKGTPSDTSDDETRKITEIFDQDGNLVHFKQVYTLVEDRDGALWIGYDAGILVINTPNNVFESTFKGSKIKIPRDDGSNFADILLDNTPVSTIHVDAANRKWIGTLGGGVYAVSEDGQEILHHFTPSNSYLPSNNVYSIASIPTTGEVYMGTDQGLVSYRTDATEGGVNYSQVSVYPNPLVGSYNGVITITGLQEQSLVKIFSLSGTLLYQQTSNGGTLTWSGCTSSGARVPAGIYLVYASNQSGEEGVVAKIMVTE